MRFAAILFSLSFLMLSSHTGAQSAPSLNLMPQPASLAPGSGALRIDANFSVAFTGHSEPRLRHAADRFFAQLQQQTGLSRFAEKLSTESGCQRFGNTG